MGIINEIEIKFSHKYKDYYKQLNRYFVRDKGKKTGIDWNDCCYVPMAASIALITKGDPNPRLDKNILSDSCLMSALSGWKANNKSIIKIDELKKHRILNRKYEELVIDDKNIFDKIGYGTFLELEIEPLKLLDVDMNGVLLHIEHDVNENRLELRANIIEKNKRIFLLVLHLCKNKSIHYCINDTLKFTSEKIENAIKNDNIVNIEKLAVNKELNESDRIYYLNYLVFYTVLNFLQ